MSAVAVIDAGDGGLAVAGPLAIRGHEVRAADVNRAVIEPVAKTFARRTPDDPR